MGEKRVKVETPFLQNKMTHDELLEKITISSIYPLLLVNALRAVVKLHTQLIKDDGTNRCEICWTSYPCSTIRAIEKELE